MWVAKEAARFKSMHDEKLSNGFRPLFLLLLISATKLFAGGSQPASQPQSRAGRPFNEPWKNITTYAEFCLHTTRRARRGRNIRSGREAIGLVTSIKQSAAGA